MARLPLTRFLIFLSVLLLPVAPMAADEEASDQKTPEYVSLGESMVLNLSSDNGRLTFLQLAADVLVKDDDAKEIVEAHIPAIRHKLIVMLSEQSAADMKSPLKREEVRQQITVAVRDMIKVMSDNEDIEEVLFSTFLVQ